MKGISPLIASVLLIAFTVAVAGLLSSWLTSFTKQSSERVSTESTMQLVCSYGGISLSGLKFNTTTNANMTGTITNTQTISLGNLTIQIIYLNKSIYSHKLCLSGSIAVGCAVANLSLSPGEATTFNVGTSSSYETVRIYSNCSNVYDSASSSDVTTTT